MKCIKCGKNIEKEYFEGVHGPLCKKCLLDLMVYHALSSMGMVKTLERNMYND